MKKFYDGKIYLSLSIISLVFVIILAAVSYYSILSVEPEVESLIEKGLVIDHSAAGLSADESLKLKKDISNYYKEAYLILRDPQLFAGYENYDYGASKVPSILKDFDKKIADGELFDDVNSKELKILLLRRKEGSLLGRTTMFYFILFFIITSGFYLNERRFFKNK